MKWLQTTNHQTQTLKQTNHWLIIDWLYHGIIVWGFEQVWRINSQLPIVVVVGLSTKKTRSWPQCPHSKHHLTARMQCSDLEETMYSRHDDFSRMMPYQYLIKAISWYTTHIYKLIINMARIIITFLSAWVIGWGDSLNMCDVPLEFTPATFTYLHVRISSFSPCALGKNKCKVILGGRGTKHM